MELKKEYSIIVYGEPKALKRHRTFRRGNFIGQYDPSKNNKADFVAAIQNNRPITLITEPIILSAMFYFQRPKNHFGTGKNSNNLKSNAPLCHTKRPDIDNLLKFVLDSLTSIFWHDDTQICQIEKACKFYSNSPRTEIIIKILQEN